MVRGFLERVRQESAAPLRWAALFGSRARGDGRPDSDLDLLLILSGRGLHLGPEVTRAESIAERNYRETGVPLSPWVVDADALRAGRRTPMLVDALADAVPLWSQRGEPIPRLSFTRTDAAFCVRCLLSCVDDGAREIRAARSRGDLLKLASQERDDLTRLSMAALLMRGETRPRGAAALRRLLAIEMESLRPETRVVLRWAMDGFGATGKPLDRPPFPIPESETELPWLRREVGGWALPLLTRFG